MKIISRSQFGKLHKAYALSRQGYPVEIIRNIVSLADRDVKVLDLGCGTGISTRQIAETGFEVYVLILIKR